MRRKQIDFKTASVAATYYEPAYQRLRLWHQGQMIDLLGFVRETPESVRQLMAEYGAARSQTFRAPCFDEVWEVPHTALRHGQLGSEVAAFDRKLIEVMGCLNGRFSDKCGSLVWADNSEQDERRSHVASQLLRESANKSGRSRS